MCMKYFYLRICWSAVYRFFFFCCFVVWGGTVCSTYPSILVASRRGVLEFVFFGGDPLWGGKCLQQETLEPEDLTA